MGTVLAIVGAASFIGYLIWLIVRIIGMLLSVVMALGGLSTFAGTEDVTSKKADSSPKSDVVDKADLLTESEIKELYSNPSKYKNRSLEMFGKVFTMPEYDSDAIYFQMCADPKIAK